MIGSVIIVLISGILFSINFSKQVSLARSSFEIENQIKKLNIFYKNYLDLVSEKQRFQLRVEPENKSNFELLKRSLDSQMDTLYQLDQFSEEFRLFEETYSSRIAQVERQMGYFEEFPADSAQSKIASEWPQIQNLSSQVANSYQGLLEGLILESQQTKSQYFEMTRFNSFYFIISVIFLITLILVNYFLGNREYAKQLREKVLESRLLEIQKDSFEFKTAFESAAIGMGLVDNSGKWIKVNPSLCKMLEYTPEELASLTFQEITHPDDLFDDLEQAKRLRNREIDSYTIEKRYLTKSGKIVWVNLSGTAVWNLDGSFRYYIAQIENITSRKKSHELLQIERDRLSNVIEGTRAGTWEWNVQTGETVFNENWANVLGYTLSELEPITINTWVSFTHPDDLELSNQKLQECFNQKSNYYECYCRMRHRDGHWIWILDRGKVVSWTEDGKPLKMFGTHTDVSELKTLESELTQKNSFIKKVLDSIDVGIVVCDEHGKLTLFNEATLAIHGLDAEDIPHSEWAQYYQLLDSESLLPLTETEVPLYKAWKGESVVSQEMAIRHPNGQIILVETSGGPILSNEGQILGAVVAMKDVTAKRHASALIEKSERKFKGIFNSTFQFIGFLEPDGTVLEANQTALDFAGLVPTDVIGKKFWDCFWWQISPETQRQLQNAVEKAGKGEFIQYEVQVWDKYKNPVTVLFNLKPLLDEYGQVVAIIPEGRLIQDIIDIRKSLEEKNHELERFASVASHDLKEPLRMVINFLQLLEKKYKGSLDEKADQYIHFAVDASQRMSRLVNDLLEYSRIGTKQTESENIDLNLLVQSQEKYFAPLLDECEGSIKYGQLPTIYGKDVPIQTLFRNLISNSIKYRKPEVPPQIEIRAKELPTHWEFAISDNGIGFDPAQSDRIFDIFTRLHTSQHYQGTGLGLAICKKIVEQHRGKIWAESIPGMGSTFYFTLGKI